ncbi:MAG: VacJ family lipoprotein [Gammaproteobacteria bacterium]|nr:VacJ family lipoprotein [Gammaproteobacteria bacterium]
MSRLALAVLFFFIAQVSFSASPTTTQPPTFNAQDPYESTNRHIHDFNMAFDATFLRPPSTLYYHVLPNPVRAGINNFYTNLHLLPTVANDLLQADWPHTVKDFWRFVVNSTIGVAGIFDVASITFNLPVHSNDLGLTFAKWGDKTSPYIVIPFLGPSTIRDGMGMLFDYTLFTPYPYINNQAVIYSLLAVRYLDLRSQLIEQEPLLKQSLDPYTFIRDAYLQHRQFIITGEKPNEGAVYLDEDIEEPVLTAKPPSPPAH